MIYDKVDYSKIEVGTPTKFKDENKYLFPVYYDDSDLVFTLKNKYFIIEGLKTNAFGKDYIEIKSKELKDIINDIVDKLKINVFNESFVRVNVNDKTIINKKGQDLYNSSFKALVSIHIPTYYKDSKKESIQVNAKEIIITEFIKEGIEYDIEKLTLAN
nr:single-strand binding protein [Saccharomycopsis fibuligera]WOF72333.1 single-strand binding protein [Saccharomycopsis fibuligera]WOF72347.1 single-strand binding protein [Saccharomycopsis fibuligera]